MVNIPNFESFLQKRYKRINHVLHKQLATITRGGPNGLTAAMRYALLNGGKRLRPLLVYAVGETFGADIKTLDIPACALEMIHAFSLVHDDLPAMDNDTLRRGKPTCHIAFDEATAILTGDALAIAPFQILNQTKTLSAKKKILMSEVLATASGPAGMAGGQYIDLHPFNSRPSKNSLKKIYLLKTGALISAAVKLGGIAADINHKKLTLLEQFALTIGLAFQIKDDILNIEGDTAKLGKNTGTDSAQNKLTYPALFGIKQAKIKIAALWRQSQNILRQLKIEDGILQELTKHIMQREF